MWKKIINPKTGRKVSIYGKIGKKVLRNYLLQANGGASTSGCSDGRYHTDGTMNAAMLNIINNADGDSTIAGILIHQEYQNAALQTEIKFSPSTGFGGFCIDTLDNWQRISNYANQISGVLRLKIN
tara:strand:- start:305 stop:682 length:378 start_codon:yes stop_codon:yes gene_type:complete